MRVGKARDYKRYCIRVGAADADGGWITGGYWEFEPTLREARLRRTEMARGVGLPSNAIGIYVNAIFTQEGYTQPGTRIE